MVQTTSLRDLLVLGALASSTHAAIILPRIPQAPSSSPAAAAIPSSTASQTSVQQSEDGSTTAAPSSTTTQAMPLVLLSIAKSLISENYPDETITDVGTLTWPTTVVLGSKTYTISPKVTSSSTDSETTRDAPSQTEEIVKPTETSAKTVSNTDGNDWGDKRLGIIIGAVVGAVCLILLTLIFCCLRRRKRDNGSFFLRRSTPSTRSNGSWMPGSNRPDTYGNTTYVSAAPALDREPKYPQVSTIPRGNTPPVAMHPAFLHHESSRSTSDENPFYTPDETSRTKLNMHEIDGQEVKYVEMEHDEPANRRSLADDRPPTPFSPLMMLQQPGPSHQPAIYTNPFSSPEDEEADDVVSPIVPPTRNPERRYSPMVHYPSWDEVSAFSFSGDEREGHHEDGGDGWRPPPGRQNGRYELA
jgi:hypothetical protein